MPRHLASCLYLLLLCLQLGLAQGVRAQALQVDALPLGPAGRYSQALQEADAPLTVEQAISHFQQGFGQPGHRPAEKPYQMGGNHRDEGLSPRFHK